MGSMFSSPEGKKTYKAKIKNGLESKMNKAAKNYENATNRERNATDRKRKAENNIRRAKRNQNDAKGRHETFSGFLNDMKI